MCISNDKEATMIKDNKTTHDPINYRNMCEPHSSVESLNQDLEGFFEELRDLREQYGLADVVVIVESPYEKDGSETNGHASLFLGDQNKPIGILATELGRARRELNDMLDKVSKGLPK